MKFGRFVLNDDQTIKRGVFEGTVVMEITGDMFGKWDYTGREYSVIDVRRMAPIEPKHIIGIGANFVSHKDELPETLPEIPVFFYKPTSSVIGHNSPIIIPQNIDEVKFEAELAVVIGSETRKISKEDALDAVFGYTIGNDVTAPQFFHEDGHWMIGKSFNTFTPLGPVIETELDLASIRIQSFLNCEKKQDSPLNLMIFSIQDMIAYLSNIMTLQPGDVILTGSPVGAEFLKQGDVIECHIDGIGSLSNTVRTYKEEEILSV